MVLEQGYHVYNAAMPHGPIDLIAIKDGEMLFVDVKTLGKNPQGRLGANKKDIEEAKSKGVKILYFELEAQEFIWADDVIEKLDIHKNRKKKYLVKRKL